MKKPIKTAIIFIAIILLTIIFYKAATHESEIVCCKTENTTISYELTTHKECTIPEADTVKEMIEGYFTLYLHNVYVRKRYNEYINVMVQDDEIFSEILNKALNLQPRYRKNKKEIKDRINNLIYGSKLKHEHINDCLDW